MFILWVGSGIAVKRQLLTAQVRGNYVIKKILPSLQEQKISNRNNWGGSLPFITCRIFIIYTFCNFHNGQLYMTNTTFPDNGVGFDITAYSYIMHPISSNLKSSLAEMTCGWISICAKILPYIWNSHWYFTAGSHNFIYNFYENSSLYAIHSNPFTTYILRR